MAIPGPDTIQRHELPNGIVVLVYENDSSPSVAISGYLWAGALDEPAELAGLASFTADCLSHGAGRRTMAELYDEVESIGASFGVEGERHLTSFGAKCLAEDTRFMLGILSDVLRRPTFPPAEIERVRGEFLTSLEIRAHDTRAMADLTFRELAYGEHPYGRSVDGTIATIQRVRRRDLQRFHREHYGPQGLTLSFAGALHAADALLWAGEAFGDWQAARGQRPPLPPAPPVDGIRSRHAPIPGKAQTDIVLGVPGPPRAEPDFLAARLANSVLGVFGMMGRLGNSVRDEQGLAYYSYSRVDGGLGPGPWAVIAGVDPANVERAVASIRAEIERLVSEPIPAEELDENKAYMTGSLPLALETNDSLARVIADIELYGLGRDYLERFAGLIGALTPEDLQAAARRYLDPERYVLATAGPAA